MWAVRIVQLSMKCWWKCSRVNRWKASLVVACILVALVIRSIWSTPVCEFRSQQDELVRNKLLRTVIAPPEFHYLQTHETVTNSLPASKSLLLTAATSGSPTSAQNVLATTFAQTSQQDQVPLHLLRQSSNPDVIARGEVQRLQVQKFCQKYHFPDQYASLFGMGHSVLNEFKRHLIFSDEKELIYCFVPKHGCTNLKRLMLYTTGDIPLQTLDWPWVEDSVYLEPALSRSSLLNASLTDMQRQNRIKLYNKFMVVRNPLERLVSAFQDKMKPPVSYTLRSIFPHKLKIELLQTHRRLDYARWKRVAGSYNLSLTFSNFIDYFIQANPSEINEHFKNSLAICHPCIVQYDFYPHFRNLSTDIPSIIDRFGLNPKYYRNKSLHKDHDETNHLLGHYYSQLSHVQRVKLFAILYEELDFYYHVYPWEYNSHVHILGITEIIRHT